MPQTKLPPGVPDFDTWLKEKKAVGPQKRERKGGGFPWMPNMAAVKGMGFSAKMGAVLASRLGVMGLIATLSTGAAGLGAMNKARINEAAEAHKKKQFQNQLLKDHILRQHEAMKRAVPSKDGVRNDTLGFVHQGSLPTAASADAATAAAAAAAANASGSKEGEGADDGKGSKEGEGAAPMDPNAMAAAMMGGAGAQAGAGAAAAGSGRGFGQLSQGLSGMRGGGGMSGGVGRGFDSPNLKNSMLAKADAMKGSNLAGFTDSRMRKGAKEKWAARGNKTANARSSKAANQLRNLQRTVAGARGADAQKAAATTNTAWEAAAPTGQAITGPGASGPTAAGPASGTVGTPTAPGEGGPMNGSVNSGGPDDFNLPQGPPDIPPFEEVTPYKWAIDLAKTLIWACIALGLVLAICRNSFFGAGIAAIIAYAIAVMAGIVALLGAYMMAMGQYWQGTMYVVMGSFMAVSALALAETFSAYTSAETIAYSQIMWPLLGMGAAGGLGAGLADVAADGDNDYDAQHDEYKKKWGVDKDGNIQNREKFDKRYGEGAADEWDENRGDMT